MFYSGPKIKIIKHVLDKRYYTTVDVKVIDNYNKRYP